MDGIKVVLGHISSCKLPSCFALYYRDILSAQPKLSFPEIPIFPLSNRSSSLVYFCLFLHSSPFSIPFYDRLPFLHVFNIGLFGAHNPVAFLHRAWKGA